MTVHCGHRLGCVRMGWPFGDSVRALAIRRAVGTLIGPFLVAAVTSFASSGTKADPVTLLIGAAFVSAQDAAASMTGLQEGNRFNAIANLVRTGQLRPPVSAANPFRSNCTHCSRIVLVTISTYRVTLTLETPVRCVLIVEVVTPTM